MGLYSAVASLQYQNCQLVLVFRTVGDSALSPGPVLRRFTITDICRVRRHLEHWCREWLLDQKTQGSMYCAW